MKESDQINIEKLVTIVVKPNMNNYAELFRDISIGMVALLCFILMVCGVIE